MTRNIYTADIIARAKEYGRPTDERLLALRGKMEVFGWEWLSCGSTRSVLCRGGSVIKMPARMQEPCDDEDDCDCRMCEAERNGWNAGIADNLLEAHVWNCTKHPALAPTGLLVFHGMPLAVQPKLRTRYNERDDKDSMAMIKKMKEDGELYDQGYFGQAGRWGHDDSMRIYDFAFETRYFFASPVDAPSSEL